MQIIIDETLCNKIEGLQYEVESRKDIITQILAGNFTVRGELFNQYQQEYKQFFIDYNKAKQEMLLQYDVGNNVVWNLDFRTRTLTIEA